jgi:predicted O-linked N-acetylglucosamine transferase (SPINDLY family)
MQLIAVAPLAAGSSASPEPAHAYLAHHIALAEAGDLSVTALIGAAETLRARGGQALVASLFRVWLHHNHAHPLAYAARFNLAVALSDAGALTDARDELQQALRDQPDFAPASINLGAALERLGDRPAAIEAWRALANRLGAVTGEAVSYRTSALNQMGRVLEQATILAPAESALRASLELDPAQPEVVQHLVALRQAQCAWPALAPVGRLDGNALLAGSSPLALPALLDDPVLHLANGHRYQMQDARVAGPTTVGHWPPPETMVSMKRSTPLRIGYVSSDLREHAVGFLTSELFELHDRTRATAHAYYCGIAREDPTKARFRASADQWTDIRGMTDKQAAAAIVADGIDILVDLNGYTKDGRIKLFGYRPAPVIVNWLGFPGSTGSPHHHYIIADRHIIPPEDEIFYSERVLRLACYQPSDRHRVVDDATPTRAQSGLPADAFVFCVFNGPQKITPDLFAIWMELLRGVPRAVLWLLCPDDMVADHLRGHAAASGIDAGRLVFAGRMGNPQHMARYRLADLFLDTAPYGAHTTASDALWMGVPVLTVAGRGFAARVCASLVRAAGLPELVCNDWPHYRDLAVALARDPPRLAALAARLRATRDQTALFDTPGLVRQLEDLYAGMWRDYCAGTLPTPRLGHLPTYHAIGCDAARPMLPDRATLLAWWRARLTYRDAVSPLSEDPLLWPERRLPS